MEERTEGTNGDVVAVDNLAAERDGVGERGTQEPQALPIAWRSSRVDVPGKCGR